MKFIIENDQIITRSNFLHLIENFNSFDQKIITDKISILYSALCAGIKHNKKISLYESNNQFNIEFIDHDYSSIMLLTSGSTGLSKQIEISYDKLINNLKISEKFNNDIWAFNYHPCHIAGLQIFFQAFLNKDNQLIYFFNKVYDQEYIANSIIKHNITRLSSTPTFYKLLINTDKVFDNVKSITSGGEKLDQNLYDLLKIKFPNAVFKNIYAATEFGNLLISNSNIFSIPNKLRNKIKISDDFELIVHNSLLFAQQDNEWYNTGDIIEFIEQDKFIFKTRNHNIIKVAGNKVDLCFIESKIQNIDGVIDVNVYAKKNSVIGNIIIADVVVVNDNVISIIEASLNDLNKFEKPQIINKVTKLSTTNTLKKLK